jgi:hypothetical protein
LGLPLLAPPGPSGTQGFFVSIYSFLDPCMMDNIPYINEKNDFMRLGQPNTCYFDLLLYFIIFHLDC